MDRLFGSQRHKTGYRQEILAGMTTFLTMASIIIVNPAILEDAGTPRNTTVSLPGRRQEGRL
jgi:AGZA family xanthine/uracil permease-like MFS transporter